MNKYDESKSASNIKEDQKSEYSFFGNDKENK